MLSEEFIAALPRIGGDELSDMVVHAEEIACGLEQYGDPATAELLQELSAVAWEELRRREKAPPA